MFSIFTSQRFLLSHGVAAIVFCYGMFSHACEYLDEAKKVFKARPAIFADNFEVEHYQLALRESIKASLRIYYKKYRAQEIKDFSNACLVKYPQIEAKFNELLPIIFIEQSFNELSLLKTPVASKFYQLVKDRYGVGTLLGIHLIGHAEQAPTIYPAGYKRGDNSIFMNLEKIKGSDWLLVLTHELLHAVDPFLAQATDVFGSELSFEVEQIAKEYSDSQWQELTSEQQKKVDQFLLAGLDRGFLAEVRAWSRTLQIYEEGLVRGFFQQTIWMENLQKSPGQSAIERAIHALDQNFYPQTEWIFSKPLIWNRVLTIRDQLREHPEET